MIALKIYSIIWTLIIIFFEIITAFSEEDNADKKVSLIALILYLPVLIYLILS